jgi:ribosomal protein L11 methylase PrmA
MESGLDTLGSPEGYLIHSGILAEREADIRAAAESHRLKVVARKMTGDWVAFTLQR